MDSKPRFSLLTILAGIYPFLYFGPIVLLLSYPYPYPAWRLDPTFQAGMAVLSMLPIATGFTVGWLKRFPLWSYPYTCLVALFLLFGGISLMYGNLDFDANAPALVGWFLAAALVLLLTFLTRHDLPLRGLVEDIRADWTRLSLGLLVMPAVAFSGIDHEEDPALTVFVIAPVLVLLVTAWLALSAKSKERRALVLAVGMLLTLLVRLPSGQFYILIYWLFTTAFVFAPALIERRARQMDVGAR